MISMEHFKNHKYYKIFQRLATLKEQGELKVKSGLLPCSGKNCKTNRNIFQKSRETQAVDCRMATPLESIQKHVPTEKCQKNGANN